MCLHLTFQVLKISENFNFNVYFLFTDGCVIPEGTEIIDNLWGACRSRESWGEDAEEFIPERFFREVQPADPAAFAAFSYGRRICIGRFLQFIRDQIAIKISLKSVDIIYIL